MLINRIIPVLLLSNNGLVKTKKFSSPKYVGDPINAVKIFNDKEVDELIFLDVDATKLKREPNLDLLKNIASECFMPLAYGGGISSVKNAEDVINVGIEKIVLNSSALVNPTLINELSKVLGSQSVVVAVDVKNTIFGDYIIFSHSSKKRANYNLLEYIKMIQDLGAGEIFINSVNRDGMMTGYDIELIKLILDQAEVPLVFCGGASSLDDFIEVSKINKYVGLAAGSIFVFKGTHRAVLINYPDLDKLKEMMVSQ